MSTDDIGLGPKLVLAVGALSTISYSIATVEQAFAEGSVPLLWCAKLVVGLLVTVLLAAALNHHSGKG